MEGDTVTLQDIFEYRIDKNQNRARRSARLQPVCVPRAASFERHGVRLPRYMDQHSFSDERMAGAGGAVAAPERPVAAAFGTRPSRAVQAVRSMSLSSPLGAVIVSAVCGLLIGVAC